jgi:hypothetical protein
MNVRPICFMVMPYGIKATQAPEGGGAPARIDFDLLWRTAMQPAITSLGYDAVRADEDLGASIIQEMIERLAISDLVVADISIANANVYYEVGIRHAAAPKGCVLVAADWAAPLFDISQMRQVRYTLPTEAIDDATASTIQEQLKAGIAALAEGSSPFHHALPGFPENLDKARLSSFRGRLHDLSEFQAAVSATRRAPDGERRARALALEKAHFTGSPIQQVVAIDLLYLLRDCTDWETTLAFINELPESLQRMPFVQEQRALAQAKTGDHLGSIGALESLMKDFGETSERRGIIGGSYKKLMSATDDPVLVKRYLSLAIENYERGMYLDLNDYFPSSNLARLYRARNKKGDDKRVLVSAAVTEVACERARRNNSADPWLKPTLLGAAFDAGDVDTARDLAEEVGQDGPAAWHLDSTLADLERAIGFVEDPESAADLAGICAELRALLPKPVAGPA